MVASLDTKGSIYSTNREYEVMYRCHQNEKDQLNHHHDLTEEDNEPIKSLSDGDFYYHGSPQTLTYHIPTLNNSTPDSAHSPHNLSSAYSSEESALLGTFKDQLIFLKEERKRTRKLLTPEQTRILEAVLKKTVYPSTPLREAVARQLGIPARKVQIWFQNKRQGRRRTPSRRTIPTGRNASQQLLDWSSKAIVDHNGNNSERQGEGARLSPASFSREENKYLKQSRSATIVRARAHSDLTSPSNVSHDRNYLVFSSANPKQRTFTLSDKHCTSDPEAQNDSTRLCESFPSHFDTATTSKSLSAQIFPLPNQENHNTVCPSIPSWSPASCHRERPPPLSFDSRSRKGSNESTGTSMGSPRVVWSSNRSTYSPSSSTITTTAYFSELSVRSDKNLEQKSNTSPNYSHLILEHSTPIDLKAKREGLQLPPIHSFDLASEAAQRFETLPSISEIVRV